MCRVYNQIGSLTAIQSHLRLHNINDYSSTKDLIYFRNNFQAYRQNILLEHKVLIEEEKINLNAELIQLDNLIKAKKKELLQQLISKIKKTKLRLNNLNFTSSNKIQVLINCLLKIIFKLVIRLKKLIYFYQVRFTFKKLKENYQQKYNHYLYITSNFEEVVKESSSKQIQELDIKKEIIDQINNSIYGAIGEQKVVRELEKLPDNHILINDFSCWFEPPIYNQQENDYIKSIQIDHILIAPSGVFLIETKNWSQESQQNIRLFSPVQQIKRANFALFKILNGGISKSKLIIKNHHWGMKKIPIKNLIVFVNHKPNEEFQYVKILALNELLGYLKYFQPCFTDRETEKIANHLRYFR